MKKSKGKKMFSKKLIQQSIVSAPNIRFDSAAALAELESAVGGYGMNYQTAAVQVEDGMIQSLLVGEINALRFKLRNLEYLVKNYLGVLTQEKVQTAVISNAGHGSSNLFAGNTSVSGL